MRTKQRKPAAGSGTIRTAAGVRDIIPVTGAWNTRAATGVRDIRAAGTVRDTRPAAGVRETRSSSGRRSPERQPDAIPPILDRSGLPPLPRSFYLRGTVSVARDLLGKILCRRVGTSLLAGRIVEVEAYLGARDPAAHTFRGRTPRNAVMFREGGHLYVYFTYGMHFCCNVVTRSEGVGEAVLIRALEPVAGIAAMARNRGKQKGDVKLLTSGPARACQALRIGREENGTDLTGDLIWLAEGPERPQEPIVRSARIGISNGREHLWRFFLKGNKFVSRQG